MHSPVHPPPVHRRQLLRAGGALGLAVATRAVVKPAAAAPPRPRPFRLAFAPHPGQFKHSAPGGVEDEIRFAADQGFSAWEDNNMKKRPPDEQERLGRLLADRGMAMGIFVMNRDTGFRQGGSLTTGDPALRDQFLQEVKDSIDVARRVRARWMTSLVGNADARLPAGYQFANAVDAVRRAADLLEPHGLVMVWEPLNVIVNHPGFFIHSNDGLYALCKAVGRPSCKILFDLYHSQINEGNLLYNFDRCRDEVAYVQTGDVPGRAEPGTGEVNYRNVLRHIHDKGYRGILGIEHGASKPGKDGEAALIAAYRDVDVRDAPATSGKAPGAPRDGARPAEPAPPAPRR